MEPHSRQARRPRDPGALPFPDMPPSRPTRVRTPTHHAPGAEAAFRDLRRNALRPVRARRGPSASRNAPVTRGTAPPPAPPTHPAGGLMKRTLTPLALTALALAAACSDAAQAPLATADGRTAPVLSASEGRGIDGQYIVELNDGADPRAAAAVAGLSPPYVYTAAL